VRVLLVHHTHQSIEARTINQQGQILLTKNTNKSDMMLFYSHELEYLDQKNGNVRVFHIAVNRINKHQL
jgi:hypothetical protein